MPTVTPHSASTTAIDYIIQGIQAKNEEAFSKLYNQYAANLMGIIKTIIADTYMAEEVLQNVFMKVWLHSHTYHSAKGSFFTWMINIAKNEAIDVTRSKRYKQYYVTATDSYMMNIAGENPYRLLDGIGLRSSLGALIPIEKQIIELAHYRGYTCQEIADALHMPLSTVKTKMQKVYKFLRMALQGTNN